MVNQWEEFEARIRTAAAAVAATEAELKAQREERNQAMQQGRDAGMTYRAVAAAAGMTEIGARRALGQS